MKKGRRRRRRRRRRRIVVIVVGIEAKRVQNVQRKVIGV